MKTLGNIVWALFYGIWAALVWLILGVLCCVLIITIPVGKQCFKLAGLYFAPFGKTVKSDFGAHPIANVIWAILFGWEMAVASFTVGLVFYILILTIPLGRQCFKLGVLSLFPFGASAKLTRK